MTDKQTTPIAPAVRLLHGINKQDLISDHGAVFEIDESYVDPEASETDLDDRHSYSKSDYSHYFNDINFANRKTKDSKRNAGDDDNEDCSSPFQLMSEDMEDISPARNKGILKLITKQSMSEEQVTMESLVYIHYNAYVENSDEPFDSTYMRNRVSKINMSKFETIEGLTIALLTMCVGEISRFIIKPEYAFGANGIPPRIPKNATLLYKLELVKIHEAGPINKYFNMPYSERLNAGYPLIKKVGEKYMTEAKVHFKSKRYGTASKRYDEAISILEGVRMADSVEEADQQALMLKLYVNAAVSFSLCKSFPRVITLCGDALRIDNQSTKALFLMGKAFRNVGEFTKARIYMVKAKKLNPDNLDIACEMNLLMNKQNKQKEIDSMIYKKMFEIKVKDNSASSSGLVTDIPLVDLSLEDCSEDQKELNQTISKIFENFKNDETLTEFPIKIEDYDTRQVDYIRKIADLMNLDSVVQGQILKVGKPPL